MHRALRQIGLQKYDARGLGQCGRKRAVRSSYWLGSEGLGHCCQLTRSEVRLGQEHAQQVDGHHDSNRHYDGEDRVFDDVCKGGRVHSTLSRQLAL